MVDASSCSSASDSLSILVLFLMISPFLNECGNYVRLDSDTLVYISIIILFVIAFPIF